MFEQQIRNIQDSKASETDSVLRDKLARDLVAPLPGRLMSFQDAPDNAGVRYGLLTARGLAAVPEGMLNTAVHIIKNPLGTLEIVGSAAAMAVVLKTVLPEGGLAGKLAGAGIGLYFTYQAAMPIFDSYKKAGQAQKLSEMDLAYKQFGNAGGEFVVNSAIAALGYKLGSHYTDRVLSSKSMDGFADAKSNFYGKLGNVGSRISENLGFGPAASDSALSAGSNPGGKSTRVRLGGSERQAPPGTQKGDLDPNTPMEVNVMLKSKASDLRMNRTLARIAQGRQAPLSDPEFVRQFGAKQESLDAVSKFAKEYGLKISESDLVSGRVVLSGKAADFTTAFETKLAQYEGPGGVQFRGRVGHLSVPSELTKHITGILGTDDRPQARTYVKYFENKDSSKGTGETPKDPRASSAFMPDEVANAYNFPKDTTGKGQAVAIIELGGGLDKADNSRYYKDHGKPEPKINIIEVNGARNKPGFDSAADREVHLDSQVIGTAAPGATQNLIFVVNSDKGFIDAVTRATFPQAGEMRNSAISISWGAPEELWTKQGIEGMSQAFKKAALKGISIFAASGDDGALDRSRSGRWQVDYPASDPSVTGTGGTRLTTAGGKWQSEVAWNNRRENDATGGGVSQVFGPQEFQKDVRVPPNANPGGQLGRGVPDIAGNADPVTGYRIRVEGAETVIGGTSAVSPLYSALTMRLNEALAKDVGNLNPWLYRNTRIFNDIVLGDNNAYKAGPGWDAVTGLGSIDGTKMLQALQSSPNVLPIFGQYRFVGPAQITFDSSQNKAR